MLFNLEQQPFCLPIRTKTGVGYFAKSMSTTFRKQLMHVMGNNGNRDHAGYVLLPDATTSPQQRIL